ncbi:HNH endonuclease signature motif containing protein [Streptomyces sp. ECR3.8]|uniref:HNH endonuclease signature motif containing protein n=1 Tax=Streptomyces sp. ECR3.8 TaxID=3461009 RepID=UPI0040423657
MSQSLQIPPKRTVRGPGGQTLAQRILRLTDRSSECWLWLSRKNPKGYGQMTVDGHPRSAHRVSYEAFVGPIPDGLEIDHLCRVRHCVNPSHLEPVTRSENIRRAIAATGMVAGKRVGGLQFGETCGAGHVIDADNSYVKRGIICCLTCRRESNRRSMSGGRERQRSYTDHSKVAAAARAQAGEWVTVTVYRSANSAYQTTSQIRTAKKLPFYRPAGSFEAQHRKVDGGFEVFARFVGTAEGGAR